ncbi:unnamed protein product [Ectocarpus sp. 8 AP-2014]
MPAENTNKVFDHNLESFVTLGHSTAVHDRGNATESRADASAATTAKPHTDGSYIAPRSQ